MYDIQDSFDIMFWCWYANPEERPSFHDLLMLVGDAFTKQFTEASVHVVHNPRTNYITVAYESQIGGVRARFRCLFFRVGTYGNTQMGGLGIHPDHVVDRNARVCAKKDVCGLAQDCAHSWNQRKELQFNLVRGVARIPFFFKAKSSLLHVFGLLLRYAHCWLITVGLA